MPGPFLLSFFLAAAAAPAAGAVPGPAASSTPTVITVAAVGDNRMDGPIAWVASRNGSSTPVSGVKRWLDADIVFGNLEGAVTARGTAADKKWVFRAPPRGLDLMKDAGFTAVSLANNHVMDYGAVGLRDTIAALDERGILHSGAGTDAVRAREPVFIERKGKRIGLLALTTTLPESMYAGPNSPGVAYAEFENVEGWVRAAKSRCDFLLVSFHGGTELDAAPNKVQDGFVKRAAAGGADVVLGHHTHVLQPVQRIGKTLVLHSLGNFLFVSPTPGTERTVIARLALGPGGVSADFVPVQIDWGRLRPARPGELAPFREALDARGALSAEPSRLRLLDPSGLE